MKPDLVNQITDAATGGPAFQTALAQVENELQRGVLPGIVVGVTDRTNTLVRIVRGYSDLKLKVPLGFEDRFPIGSISKSFTSIALMTLYDQGRFDPSASLQDYLPWFKTEERLGAINGHHLLSNTSGLPFYRADLASMRYVAQAMRSICQVCAPGQNYWYSNIGFQLLGYVLETIEGRSYADIVRSLLFDPIKMQSSLPAITNTLRRKLPISYRHWQGREYVEAPWFEYTAADGSIVSNIDDMCSYARLILNRGALMDNQRLLSVEAFERVVTPVANDYGYGFWVRNEDGNVVASHRGSIAGYSCGLHVGITEGVAVIVMSNAPHEPALERRIFDIFRAAYHGGRIKSSPPPLSSNALSDLKHCAGTYTGIGEGSLEFRVASGKLFVKSGDKAQVELHGYSGGVFVTSDAEGDESSYLFAREFNQKSNRFMVYDGKKWYSRRTSDVEQTSSLSLAHDAYVGTYRNHNNESNDVQIISLAGRLLCFGAPPWDNTIIALEDLGEGKFRPEDPWYNPERIEFDTFVDGRALRLRFSGMPMYRIDSC